MKIKYNNFLIIVPIFILIASVMSYLNYINEVKEIKWGMQTKAKSIEIPSRIFIEEMLKKQKLSEILENIKPKFQNILNYNQAKRFYISQDGHILLDTDSKTNANNLSLPKNLKTTTLSEAYLKNELHIISIHSPIKNTKQNTILSIEVDNTDFIERIDEAFKEIFYVMIIATILGLITSYILSKIVTNKIYALNNNAKAIASGNYSRNSYIGSIHEFTDLGDTLNIVKSIMKEIVFKTKNTIVEEEKFRSDDDLVNTYNDVLFDSKKDTVNNINIAINSIGYPEAGYFFDSFSSSGKLSAYIAKIEEQSSSVDTLLKANAAQKYISSKINDLDVQKLQKIFNLSYLEFLSVDENNLLHSQKIVNENIKDSTIDLNDNLIHLICKDSSLVEKELNIYIQNYPELNIEDIAKDIPSIFTDVVGEIFIMIQKSTT